jgi:hypothetical protein
MKKRRLYAINELVNLTDFLFGAVQESSRKETGVRKAMFQTNLSPESNRRKLV